MFLAKKILGPLLAPLPFCLLVLLSGIFLLWATRRQKTGKTLVTLGTVLLCLFSYSMVADKLVRPLEQEYAPLTNYQSLKNVKWIVVLSGGSCVDPSLPMSTYLSDASLARLTEGVFLHNRLPETKLILTGRSGFEGITPVAEVMADTAREWGVDPEDIVVEKEATDTKDHPIYIKELVESGPFILVTSASHMPRAMGLFRKHGMEPIPAPTDYMVKEREALTPGVFFPDADSLEKAERAIHEYLGILWGKLKSQI